MANTIGMNDACPIERETQHFRGRWFGFGPVANNESVIFAVFANTNVHEKKLTSKSFTNSNLVRRTQSLARASYVTRLLFDTKIARNIDEDTESLVGISTAKVSGIRALKAEIDIGSAKRKLRAFCVLDLVEPRDVQGHATMGYAPAFELDLSQQQVGKIRAKIRMDLADVFSEINDPIHHPWPSRLQVLAARIRSVFRVIRSIF